MSDTAAPVVVGRFAPTPSGRLHMGNLFSFLVAYLVCRQAGGRMLMRIEDLDEARTKRSFSDAIMRDLEWLGFEWDGAPVWQSERTEAYLEALACLEEQGIVYPCFCSRADLHAADAPHFGDEVVYRGTCRDLSQEERITRAARRPGALRVRVTEEPIRFIDRFQGAQCYDMTRTSGDFIVRRSDGVFAYQLAVVVDDAWMGINSVVRGVDLIPSTPRQIHLQRLLNLPHPSYAHVPLIVAPDGTRLAKRNVDASLTSLIEERRWDAERIVGRLAWKAGLIPEDARCSIDELVRCANLDALRDRTAVVWDEV